MSKSTRALAAALAACILGPVPAHAAGFAIFEQGARGMGFAGAFTAQANDPVRHLPQRRRHRVPEGQAVLRRRHPHPSLHHLHRRRSVPRARPSRRRATPALLVPPAAYYTQPFSERIVFGIGLHTPFGLDHVVGQPGHVQRTVRLPEGRAQGLLDQSHRRLQAGGPVRRGLGPRRAPLVGVAAAPRARREPVHPARDRRRHRGSLEQHRRRVRLQRGRAGQDQRLALRGRALPAQGEGELQRHRQLHPDRARATRSSTRS